MTTPSQKLKTLDAVLDGLMSRYRERVPDVSGIIDALIDEKVIESANDIENDHIAFRTMGLPSLGIQSFEKIFLHYGYEKREPYDFKDAANLSSSASVLPAEAGAGADPRSARSRA